MAKLSNLARMTTSTTGAGTITLGSAVNGFKAFPSSLDGSEITYAIRDGANSEIGRGVYTHSGMTLTRASILSSTNSDAAINLSGTAEVFITPSAEDLAPGVALATTVASASTADIGAAYALYVDITGTTTITSFGTSANKLRFVKFSGALTLTHDGTSLILPGAANITTVAGDAAIFVSDGSGNWRCLEYQRSNGRHINISSFAATLLDDADAAAARATLGVTGSPSAPQGRLTLTSGVPVLTTTVTGATAVYYAPYFGRHVPLYDGTKFVMVDIGGELSQATTDTTKSPAAAANNSNYDLFVWNDAGTFRCTRGPLWSSDTARGTGSGTTELERVQGFLTNKYAITNGPAANRGLYVGTIRTNGSAAIDWSLGGLADQGVAGNLGLWNCYHRRKTVVPSSMSANSWTYNSTTPRAPNGSANMRTSFIVGLQEDDVSGRYGCPMLVGSSGGTLTNVGRVGVGYDTSSAMTGTIIGVASPTTAATGGMGFGSAKPAVGWHFMSAIEMTGAVADAVTFYGDAGAPTVFQNLLEVEWWA